MGTVVNRKCLPLMGRSLEVTLTVPLTIKLLLTLLKSSLAKKNKKKHNNHLNFTLKMKIIVSEKLNNMILFFPLLRSLTVQYNIVQSKIKTKYNTKELSTELYNTI